MDVKLPTALRPWREPLGLFGDAVTSGIGPWLSPLRALLGPMRVPKRALHGDPDGVDGLTRRGSYDRLLLSEWAVALESSDEFLRRAVMGEHVFLAPAYREPHGARTSVALLDCGPMQLGAPRLAQLAALVVLAQRAADSGTEFRVGILQHDDGKLLPLDRSTVVVWLRARSWAPIPQDATRWREALDEADAQDVWLLGHDNGLPLASTLRASALTISESNADETRRLTVRAHRYGASGDEAELWLPPPEDCMRIFRAPLSTARPRQSPTERVAMTGDTAYLTIDGRRLLVPRTDGGISALHVPTTSAEQFGRTKLLLPMQGSRLIAADLISRRLVAIAIDEDRQLLLRGGGIELRTQYEHPRVTSTVLPTTVTLPDSFGLGDDSLLRVFITSAGPARFDALLHDDHDQLWRLRVIAERERRGVTAELTVVDRGCRRPTRITRETVAWISETTGTVRASTASKKEPPSLASGELTTVVFGPTPWHGIGLPPLAWARDDGEVVLDHFPPRAPKTISAIAGRMFGVTGGRGHNFDDPELLFLRPGSEEIVAVANRPPRKLMSVRNGFAKVEHHPSCGRILAWTTSDELRVFDLQRHQTVLRVATSKGGAE